MARSMVYHCMVCEKYVVPGVERMELPKGTATTKSQAGRR